MQIGEDHVGALCRLQQLSTGRLCPANSEGGERQERLRDVILFLLAQLSTVACAPINRSNWGVGDLLRDRRRLLTSPL